MDMMCFLCDLNLKHATCERHALMLMYDQPFSVTLKFRWLAGQALPLPRIEPQPFGPLTVIFLIASFVL
jgi:hypothetical protein